MGLSSETFRKLRSNLQSYADQHEVQLGDGLLIGLVNYSLHVGVRDLGEADTEKVLDELGRRSIDLIAQGEVTPRIATGAALGYVLRVIGCSDVFGNCSGAAEKILNGRKIRIEIFGEAFKVSGEDTRGIRSRLLSEILLEERVPEAIQQIHRIDSESEEEDQSEEQSKYYSAG